MYKPYTKLGEGEALRTKEKGKGGAQQRRDSPKLPHALGVTQLSGGSMHQRTIVVLDDATLVPFEIGRLRCLILIFLVFFTMGNELKLPVELGKDLKS